MAEKNYTIPINESFEQFDGCPVCRLYNQLELRSLEYIMGAAMMEPSVRISTNQVGFCGKHYHSMMQMKNRLSLALMLETHLQEISGWIQAAMSGDKNSVKTLKDRLRQVEHCCFVCDRVAFTMERYVDNIVHLWKEDPFFREKFRKQPMICMNHTAVLLRQGSEKLHRKLLPQFAGDLVGVLLKNLDPVSDELARYCKSYDYRFAGQELGDAKLAVEHAIDLLTGQTE